MFNIADNNIKIYKTAGGSMRPFFQEHDILIIKRVPAELLKIGDIIAFIEDQQIGIVHRLIKKIKIADGTILFQTKGDANRFFDSPVSKEAIIGKVYFIEKTSKSYNDRLINLDSCFRRKMNYLLSYYHYSLGRFFYLLRYFKGKVRLILRCLCHIELH